MLFQKEKTSCLKSKSNKKNRKLLFGFIILPTMLNAVIKVIKIFCSSYFVPGIKSRAIEFIQYLLPVGAGPSSNK